MKKSSFSNFFDFLIWFHENLFLAECIIFILIKFFSLIGNDDSKVSMLCAKIDTIKISDGPVFNPANFASNNRSGQINAFDLKPSNVEISPNLNDGKTKDEARETKDVEQFKGKLVTEEVKEEREIKDIQQFEATEEVKEEEKYRI